MILKTVRDFFTFPVTQQKGLIGFLLILSFMLGIRVYLQWRPPELEADTGYLDSLVLDIEQRGRVSKPLSDHEAPIAIKAGSCVPADLNQISQAALVNLGLPDFLAKRIVKYRSKVGAFKTTEDIRKIYGIQEKQYLRVRPCLYVSQEVSTEVQSKVGQPVGRTELLDLNKADSVDLLKLKGVGPVFASRILKYRRALGGFVKVDQLKEVYGLNPETIALIEPQVKVISGDIIKLAVNKLELRELRRHPYMRWKVIQDYLYKCKKNSIPITEAEFRTLLSVEEFEKLRPYIDFGNS